MVGLLGATALLLAFAGIGKLIHPTRTARAVRLLGAPPLAGLSIVRAFGAAEIGLAAWVLVIGGAPAAGLLAAAYLILAAIAARLLRVAPQADCGCFGMPDQPISRTNVLTDIVCAAIGVAGVAWPQPALSTALANNGPWLGVGLFAMVLLLTWLLYQTVTSAPRVRRLRTRVAAR
jgi:hypothetical protein